ncbi:MAG: threonine ammonia-lyase [Terriglobales bacterium]
MNSTTQSSRAIFETALRPVTWIESRTLSERLGAHVTLASETFQHTGSFKYRAAFHLASHVPQDTILAASSGNFGQALACACQILGKHAVIVMPDTSARVKLNAVASYGATIELVDTAKISRAARLAQLATQHPEAYVASAYDDDLVIAGNATLGRELAAAGQRWDTVVVPIGGGGLIAGIACGLRQAGSRVAVVGAEPALANDAARSLRAGQLLANPAEPATLADGARTLSLGKRNWAIVQREVGEIIEIAEETIAAATGTLFADANLKVEPTGALSVGAILQQPERFAGSSVCCVVSGGNVDPDLYARLITAAPS